MEPVMSVEGLVESESQSQKDVQRGTLRPRRQHWIALVIATCFHITRPSAAQGRLSDRLRPNALTRRTVACFLIHFPVQLLVQCSLSCVFR